MTFKDLDQLDAEVHQWSGISGNEAATVHKKLSDLAARARTEIYGEEIIQGPLGKFSIPARPDLTRDHARLMCEEVWKGEYDAALPLLDAPCVIDIGSHCGAFAVWIKQKWARAKVICFEPNAAACVFARRNAPFADIRNVAVTSDTNATYNLPPDWGSARTFEVQDGARVNIVHPKDLPPADVLKIDAEGVETDVLSNYQHWDTLKVLMYEYHPFENEARAKLQATASSHDFVNLKEVAGFSGASVWVKRGLKMTIFPDVTILSAAISAASTETSREDLARLSAIRDRSKAYNDGYGTHLPVLASILSIAPPGDVLEIGAGDFSTPVLLEMCRLNGRLLYSVEPDDVWRNRYIDLDDGDDETHDYTWLFFRDEEQWSADQHFAVVLIDQLTGPSRRESIEKYRNRADFIVVHDTHNDHPHFAGVDEALATFPHRRVYDKLVPPTTVVSMTRDVNYRADHIPGYAKILPMVISPPVEIPDESPNLEAENPDLPALAPRDSVNHFWDTVEGTFMFPDFYRRLIEEEAREIYARDRRGMRFVEVGGYRGQSIAFLAVEGQRLPEDARPYLWVVEPSSARFRDHPAVQTMLHMDQVTLLGQTSLEAAEYFCKKRFLDVVFIDADHTYESVVQDIAAWWPLVAPGGIFAGHDFNFTDHPGVVRAVMEAVDANLFGDTTLHLERGVKWRGDWFPERSGLTTPDDPLGRFMNVWWVRKPKESAMAKDENVREDAHRPIASNFSKEEGPSDRIVRPRDLVMAGHGSVAHLRGGDGTQDLLIIDNFLPAALAEEVHAFLDKGMPKDWWDYSFHAPFEAVRCSNLWPNDSHTLQMIKGHRGDPELASALRVADAYAKSTEEFAADRIAYAFRRTTMHFETCGCVLCRLEDIFHSGALLNRIVEFDGKCSPDDPPFDLEVATSFASWYAPGDFLSPHSDKNNGDLAFVWNLTKDWRPQYGGNLHFLEKDWTKIDRVVQPGFNQLVIFEVGAEGIGHLVSHVAPGVTKKRLAFSGWMRKIPKGQKRSMPARRKA